MVDLAKDDLSRIVSLLYEACDLHSGIAHVYEPGYYVAFCREKLRPRGFDPEKLSPVVHYFLDHYLPLKEVIDNARGLDVPFAYAGYRLGMRRLAKDMVRIFCAHEGGREDG